MGAECRKQKSALNNSDLPDAPAKFSVNSWRASGARHFYMRADSWKDIRTVPEETALESDEEVANYSYLEGTAQGPTRVLSFKDFFEDAFGQDVDVAQPPDAWPSLTEAIHGFEECENSSVASSC